MEKAREAPVRRRVPVLLLGLLTLPIVTVLGAVLVSGRLTGDAVQAQTPTEPSAAAAPDDATADRVFGQPDFTHGLGNGCNRGNPNSPTASTLCFPFGVAVDGGGHLYVADLINNRVLEYDTPLTTDAVADRVFGQASDFTKMACNNGGIGAGSLCFTAGGKAPSPVAVDSAGNLYVADMINSRVLEYNSPLTTDTVADRVFGQASFNGSGFMSPPTASTLCIPVGVGLDGAGNLYVADRDNNRVLEYDSPLTTDTVADRVFGQASFATNTCNTAGEASAPTASTLCRPDAVGLDSAGNLYVPDTRNSRVVEYDSPLTTDTVADRVFGHGAFTTNTCNTSGPDSAPSARSLCFPFGVAVGGTGALYVADNANNRALEYDNPLTTDGVADRVFGQGGSFTTNTCNLGGTSAASLCNPQALALDSTGNLYIADGNNRVLEYDTPLTTDAVADRVFGQPDFISGGPGCNQGDGPTASTLCNPSGGVVDGSGRLYIADRTNNRVLVYDGALTTDAIADRVFGQGGDFTTGLCNKDGISASSICFVGGKTSPVTIDGAGNVYVADTFNNRVLEYDDPAATDTVADRVFGQPDFASGVCNQGGAPQPPPLPSLPTASSLCGPDGLAVDASGNVYIADRFNNRVVQYNTPLNTETIADRVLGQPNFSTSGCNQAPPSPPPAPPPPPPTASTLCDPNAVAVDLDGNLYIADGNSRVLEYDAPLTIDSVADRVFGQGGSFTSNTCNLGGISAGGLCSVAGVALDAAESLYVSDRFNNRALRYDSPLSTDTLADQVFGQGNDLTTGLCNKGGIGPGSLCFVDGVWVDTLGNLYIADSDNHRVLEYDSAEPNPCRGAAGSSATPPHDISFDRLSGAGRIRDSAAKTYTSLVTNHNLTGAEDIQVCFSVVPMFGCSAPEIDVALPYDVTPGEPDNLFVDVSGDGVRDSVALAVAHGVLPDRTERVKATVLYSSCPPPPGFQQTALDYIVQVDACHQGDPAPKGFFEGACPGTPDGANDPNKINDAPIQKAINNVLR